MERQEHIALFNSIFPHFFSGPFLRDLPEEWYSEEMLLELRDFDEGMYNKALPGSVTFGQYQGHLSKLREATDLVSPGWGRYYDGEQRIYCAFSDGALASFCLISDFGTHEIGGHTYRVGGPGCVGTLPAYRDRGIGLSMVKNVTRLLRDEGFDISFIHYTSVAAWYGKLGYRTVLRWNKHGFI